MDFCFILSVIEKFMLKYRLKFDLLATPIRGTRPSTTSTSTSQTSSINLAILSDDRSTVLLDSKTAALVSNNQQQSNVLICHSTKL